MPPRFALDQNFPTPILSALRTYIVEAELKPIRDIDSRLQTVDDWRLILALHQRQWDGLITCDSAMLRLPREMAVLAQTTLALVVTESAGHDPIRSTGLLLTHLPTVVEKLDRRKAQVFRLKAPPIAPEIPWNHLQSVAKRQGTHAQSLFDSFKLSGAELAADALV